MILYTLATLRAFLRHKISVDSVSYSLDSCALSRSRFPQTQIMEVVLRLAAASIVVARQLVVSSQTTESAAGSSQLRHVQEMMHAQILALGWP